MTKEQVVALVGASIIPVMQQPDGEEVGYYVDKRECELERHESPWALSGLVIWYKDGVLIDKKYNPQWVKREHRELYEQRTNPNQAVLPIAGKSGSG